MLGHVFPVPVIERMLRSVTGVPVPGVPRRGSRSWRPERLADNARLTARVAELAGQVAGLQESVTTLSGFYFGSY